MKHPLDPLIGGIGQGSVLFLVALGLSLTLGVMRILNISNGAFYMLGAYLSAIIFTGQSISVPEMIIAIIIGGIGSGVIGGVAEFVFIRRLYPLPHLFPLLGTYALLIAMQGAATQIWGVAPKQTNLPSLFSGNFSLAGGSVSVYNLLLIGVGLLFVCVVWALLTHTRLGRLVGATADDREMAAILGINTKRIFLGMFVLSAFMAGVGGALTAPLNGLTPSTASTYVIQAFAVVIIGGGGSVVGTYVAAIALGVLESFLVVLQPSISTVSIYIAMAAVMLVRPQGLFGRRELSQI